MTRLVFEFSLCLNTFCEPGHQNELQIMFYVYVLKSRKDGKLYFGYTQDLTNRLKEHNLGLVRSTKSRIPLRCVYYEAYASKNDAVKREHNLKLRARALRQLTIRIVSSLNA